MARLPARPGAAWSALLVARGCGRLMGALWRWAARPGREPRGPLLVLVAGAALVVGLLPYGAWFLVVGAAGVVAGLGGGRGEEEPRRLDAAAEARLRAIYEGLVPFLSLPGDPAPQPMYVPGGSWERCFPSFGFGADGRLDALRLRYPPHVPDGDAEWRRGVESLLVVRAGGDREYRFRWDGERGELAVTALRPLPAGVCVQRFVAAPGEVVLGFTDEGAVERTVPVCGWRGDDPRPVDVPAVVWRTGPRSAQPHLLVVGAPGAGATSLLRGVALQALRHGEVVLVDGSGAGEFACFPGRLGVLGVESAPRGAVGALEWVARETGRRLGADGRGGAALAGVRQLWVVVDRPVLLGHRARAEGVADPLRLLEVPLRYGRAGRVTVVLTEQCGELDVLGSTALACTRARVVLGAVPGRWVARVLGAPPGSWPLPEAPPGRGYVRLGSGPVCRLQAPAAPDPFDVGAGEAERRAVLGLLPEPVRTPEGGWPTQS